MKYLIITLLLITSCSSERICRKAIARAEKYNCFQVRDSIRFRDSTKITIKVKEVDNATDSIIEALEDLLESCGTDTIHDTTYLKAKKEKLRNDIKGIISKIPCEIEPISASNEDYSIKIWSEGGKLQYEVKLTPKKYVPSDFPKDRFWLGFALGALVAALFLYLAVKAIFSLGSKPDNNTH